jgi:hypothetical protein
VASKREFFAALLQQTRLSVAEGKAGEIVTWRVIIRDIEARIDMESSMNIELTGEDQMIVISGSNGTLDRQRFGFFPPGMFGVVPVFDYVYRSNGYFPVTAIFEIFGKYYRGCTRSILFVDGRLQSESYRNSRR